MSRVAVSQRRPGRTLFGFAASWVVAAAVLATPAIARACAVCTAGREEENQLSYLLTTIFMSLLPLVAVGTLGFVLWRRFKKLEAELEARGEADPRTGLVGSPAVVASGEQRG
jgi:hypothetical protein